MTIVALAILAIACTATIVVVLEHHLAPLVQATLRMVVLYEDCQQRTKRATERLDGYNEEREEIRRAQRGVRN